MANTRAIVLMTAAMAAFASSDAFINRASGTFPTGQLFAVTSLASFAIFFVVMLRNRDALFTKMLFNKAVLIRTTGEVFGSRGDFAADFATLGFETSKLFLLNTGELQ